MKVKLSHLVCLEESKENESQLSAAILREIIHLIHNLYIFFEIVSVSYVKIHQNV